MKHGQVTGLGQWVIAGPPVLLLQLVRDLLNAQNLWHLKIWNFLELDPLPLEPSVTASPTFTTWNYGPAVRCLWLLRWPCTEITVSWTAHSSLHRGGPKYPAKWNQAQNFINIWKSLFCRWKLNCNSHFAAFWKHSQLNKMLAMEYLRWDILQQSLLPIGCSQLFQGYKYLNLR